MKHGKWPLLAAFLLPALAVYGIFVLSPYAQAFQIALTDWQGFSGEFNYVGFDNFVYLFKNERMWNALLHNMLLVIFLPVITILLGLFFASMLNIGGRKGKVEGLPGSSLYKVIYFAPQVLSVAIIGILWKEIYNPISGLLNGGLRAIGLEGEVWLGDPKFAFWAVLAVMVWANVGFYVVLFGAAMQSIPRDIYEAAALDGSSRWNTLFRVTIPLVWDTVQVAWVYLAILALDGFALIQVMTPTGGPDHSTDVVGLRMYETAFGGESRFGIASAIGVIMFFLTLSVTLLALRLSKRERIEFS